MMREPLSSRAYSLIKRDILEGRIATETVLNERALSAKYGLSRTPLRTALSRLAREGIVRKLDGGTLLVRSVSVEQFLQIIDLRRMLESAAAARAAERGLTEGIRRESDSLLAYADGRRSSFDVFWEQDERFHLEVARAAGLRLLPGILSEHREIARRCTIGRRLDRFDEQAQEHLAILAAIEGTDPVAAQGAMDTHLRNTRARFVESLSTGRSPSGGPDSGSISGDREETA